MMNAQQFFYDHAGFSYNPATRSASDLARAETYAAGHDWEFTWEPDFDADASFVDTWDSLAQADWNSTDHECEVCILRDSDGNILSSCGGIFDADSDYRRVIQAELALEALPPI